MDTFEEYYFSLWLSDDEGTEIFPCGKTSYCFTRFEVTQKEHKLFKNDLSVGDIILIWETEFEVNLKHFKSNKEMSSWIKENIRHETD